MLAVFVDFPVDHNATVDCSVLASRYAVVFAGVCEGPLRVACPVHIGLSQPLLGADEASLYPGTKFQPNITVTTATRGTAGNDTHEAVHPGQQHPTTHRTCVVADDHMGIVNTETVGVAVEGVSETFVEQAIDQFGNTLDGAATTGAFTVRLDGAADSRAERGGAVAASSVGVVVRNDPNTDGQYGVSWDPQVAGEYVLSVNFTSHGGLLATYYRDPDFRKPILFYGANDHDHYHKAPHCPQTVVYCDSTRLEASLEVNTTAQDEPLWPLSPIAAFPQDVWSIRWEGFLQHPSPNAASTAATVVTLVAASDEPVRVTLDGVAVIDTFGGGAMQQASNEANVTLSESGALHPFVVEYKEGRAGSAMSLSWRTAPGSTAAVLVPSKSLHYTRHVNGSPMQVLVYPGAIDADTTSAVGDGLRACVAGVECYATVVARDTDGNVRFNDGSDTFTATMVGTDGWAGEGRRDDDVLTDYGTPWPVTVAVEPLEFVLLGNANAVMGSKILECLFDTAALVRGNVLHVGGETFVISDSGTADWVGDDVPLAGQFRSPSGAYSVYGRGAGVSATPAGAQTGRHQVAYTPEVEGVYALSLAPSGGAGIDGTPHFVVVSPAEADAGQTTAHGRGLVLGETGAISRFVIQAKDAYGNDRDGAQDLSRFVVAAYDPTAASGETVPGTVTSKGAGSYDVSFAPTASGVYTVAVLLQTAPERQTVQIARGASDATFAVRFAGETTIPLAYDVSADVSVVMCRRTTLKSCL